MSIRVEIPFDALSEPRVAQALAHLMVSLGAGHDTTIAGQERITKGGAGRARNKADKQSVIKKRRGATAVDLSELPPAERWQRYVEGRPEATIKFLALLEQKGTLTVHDAVTALGLASPKAMGGLTGAMARWAPKQGVELPFEARHNAQGTRYWVWNGFD